MNCEKGDLAFIVKSNAGNEGMIVRCVEYAGKACYAPPYRTQVGVDSWLIDKQIPCVEYEGKKETMLVPDEILRPIRDQPGTDEMITIAGLPNKQGVTA